MHLAYGIAVGSSLQIALFVAPLLVFASYLFGTPLDLIFTPFEVAAVTISVLIVGFVANGRRIELDGRCDVGRSAPNAGDRLFLSARLGGCGERRATPDSEFLAFPASLACLVWLSASDFIHVDDFRSLPQILLLRIRQRLHPILLRLFTESSRLCRHSRFLLGRGRICPWWRRLSFSLLGRIHINGHGSSAVICVQFPPDPRKKSMEPAGC